MNGSKVHRRHLDVDLLAHWASEPEEHRSFRLVSLGQVKTRWNVTIIREAPVQSSVISNKQRQQSGV